MEARRFDALVRSFRPRSRRRVLGGLGGIVLGALLPFHYLTTTEAKKKCKGRRKRCQGNCIKVVNDPNNCGRCGKTCSSGGCVNGACACIDELDCPGDNCTCIQRAGGEDKGTACAARLSNNKTCRDDSSCPVGSFCAKGKPRRCTVPCAS